ncbi:MAG: response regulator [Treponema sp.]|nr:response regulator [Treponema sp.]
MGLISYFYTSNIVNKQMMLISESVLNTAETAVSVQLTDRELSFTSISMNFEKLVLLGETNEELLQYLEEMNSFYLDRRTSIPDFMKIYGYFRGEFLDGSGWIPPADYDARTRPWFTGAVDNGGKVFFSEPYIDSDTGDQVISFSQVIDDASGQFYGVLAIDLNMDEITNYITNIDITNDGYTIFLTNNLVFVVHRYPDMIGRNLRDSGGDRIRLANLLVNQQPVIAENFTDSKGIDSVVFFRTIFNGWHIGIIIPRISYYRAVYDMAFVLGIMGFLFMVSLSYVLVNTTMKQMHSDDENKSKSSFLARMSHEMRTPMNAIIGMTQIAKNSDDPERVRYCLNKINDASVHLLGVINDVLDMSKIEAGKLELYNSDFDLKEMIEKVIDVVNFKIEEKNLHFDCHMDDSIPCYIHGDRQLLAQVLTNLMTNACKFTPENGKISLAVHLLESDNEKSILQFIVEDNGIGISKESQPKIFQSFEQADGSISRKYGGTGLGLVISKRIVEMMGGEISLESEEGKGTRFMFSIKAGIAEADAAQDTSQNDAESAVLPDNNDFTGKKVLLAEDVMVNREVLISLLEDTHVQIDCAENGLEVCAMFALNPEKYDLIFMDIHMPEMDGYEAAKKIRMMDHDKAKEIPIIAMTADVFREDVEKMLEAGMNCHIGKPVILEEILQNMRKYLQN